MYKSNETLHRAASSSTHTHVKNQSSAHDLSIKPQIKQTLQQSSRALKEKSGIQHQMKCAL